MDEPVNGQEKRLTEPKPESKTGTLGMQRELLQAAAMLAMLIDHIGAVFFPEQWMLRVIGRISFPLYAFGIVQGYLYTRDVKSYIRRLGLLALISELPFILAFDSWKVNVIGTFYVCILTLFLLDRIRMKIGQAAVASAAIAVLIWIPADYEYYALLLILLYRYVASYWCIPLHWFLNTVYWLSEGVLVQQFSLISTLWLAWGGNLRKVTFVVPRWLWLSFYPLHLVLFVIIKWLRF